MPPRPARPPRPIRSVTRAELAQGQRRSCGFLRYRPKSTAGVLLSGALRHRAPAATRLQRHLWLPLAMLRWQWAWQPPTARVQGRRQLAAGGSAQATRLHPLLDQMPVPGAVPGLVPGPVLKSGLARPGVPALAPAILARLVQSGLVVPRWQARPLGAGGNR